jgi:hypothetical protein
MKTKFLFIVLLAVLAFVIAEKISAEEERERQVEYLDDQRLPIKDRTLRDEDLGWEDEDDEYDLEDLDEDDIEEGIFLSLALYTDSLVSYKMEDVDTEPQNKTAVVNGDEFIAMQAPQSSAGTIYNPAILVITLLFAIVM